MKKLLLIFLLFSGVVQAQKKIRVEMTAPPGLVPFVINTVLQPLKIEVSPDKKIWVEATLYTKSSAVLTDSVWFARNGLSLRKAGDVISFTADPKKADSAGPVTLYVPRTMKLDITSKYTVVSINYDVRDVKAVITNADLNLLQDIGRLDLKAAYATITANVTVHQGIIDIANSKLKILHAEQLSLVSKNSSVSIVKTERLTVHSESDEYKVMDAVTISGEKNYGSLSVVSLAGALRLSGVNTDITIQTVRPSVKDIAVVTKYATLKIPVKKLPDYTLKYNDENPVVTGSGKPTTLRVSCDKCSINFN